MYGWWFRDLMNGIICLFIVSLEGKYQMNLFTKSAPEARSPHENQPRRQDMSHHPTGLQTVDSS